MDAASPVQKNSEVNSSHINENLQQQNNEIESRNMDNGSVEIAVAGSNSLDTGRVSMRSLPENAASVHSSIGGDNIWQTAVNNSSRFVRKGKKLASKLGSREYILRSSSNNARVLRSRSNGACKSESAPSTNPNLEHSSTERRKRRRKRKRIQKLMNDEFSSIRKRIRYLLARMSYEQSLIHAYSGEGWRGQSLEKVRPEKEIQRATSEILRCKVKIRERFQHLDGLCSEGKYQDSLFDSEGQINAEDIFCAKCGSKEYSVNNDIILCDGICDRGFHQKCLTPPLLTEEIPPGDESWLCPGCDCKVDCIGLLNDIQGTHLSIDDKWEKVFPEAAATATQDKQYDDMGLPSDDSEDGDYDPDGPELNEKVQMEASGSEESDSSSSDNSSASKNDEQSKPSRLSSDDSEDNEYDPDAPDVDQDVEKECSSSDESDFSSDTDDLGVLGNDNDSSGSDEVPVDPSWKDSELVNGSGKRRSKMTAKMRKPQNSELLSMLEPDPSGEDTQPISGKRHCERLDYKKLYDETYGNIPSSSSSDEDWAEFHPRNKEKHGVLPSKRSARSIRNGEASLKAQWRPLDKCILPKPMPDEVRITENASKRKTNEKQEVEGSDDSVSKWHKDEPEPDCIGKKGPKSYELAVSQRLYESLGVNVYPSRRTKENLSRELGLTVEQVRKWFENARRSLRLSGNKRETKAENNPPANDTVLHKTDGVVGRGAQMVSKSSTNVSGERKSNKDVEAIVGEDVGNRKDVDPRANMVANVADNRDVVEANQTEDAVEKGESVEPRASVIADTACNRGKEIQLNKVGFVESNAAEDIVGNVKHVEPRTKIVANSAGNTVEVMRLNDSTVTAHRIGNGEKRKQVARRNTWNSAKYEARKRRMDMIKDRAR